MPYGARKTADTIVAILRRHGATVEDRASTLSASRYLTVSLGDASLRVRVSDHVARPTYEAISGAADIEIGSHDMAVTTSAVHGAARILDALRAPHDRYLRAAIARSQATARRIEAADAAVRQSAQVLAAHNSDVQAAFEAWAGDRLDVTDLNARQRKRRRQNLRAQFSAETGIAWK